MKARAFISFLFAAFATSLSALNLPPLQAGEFSATAINSEIKYLRPSNSVRFDTVQYMVYDEHFEKSYKELTEMFDGVKPYNLKRAEFLVENAFYEGTMDYKVFCHDIDSVVDVLNRFIDVNYIRQHKTAPNFAIFEYFTKPSPMNGYKKFVYDFEDPLGEKDFSVFFTPKLLRTHKGQCTSMPLLYKILCDDLGGHSALAFGPMHLYIKHIGEDGKWVNVELTHGGFVRDVWLMETMNISTEAIRNGIFLCALNEKETIALMMMQLSRAYQFKYKSSDMFVVRSVDHVLNALPNFSNALVMKLNYHQDCGRKYLERYGGDPSDYLEYHHKEYHRTVTQLDSLGYSQPTVEEYNANQAKGKRLTEGQSHE